MKYLLTLSLALILFACSEADKDPVLKKVNEKFTVKGTVKHVVSHVPESNVDVQILFGTNIVHTTTTDHNGRFEIVVNNKDLFQEYRIRVQPNREFWSTKIYDEEGNARSPLLSAEHEVIDMNIEMVPAGYIHLKLRQSGAQENYDLGSIVCRSQPDKEILTFDSEDYGLFEVTVPVKANVGDAFLITYYKGTVTKPYMVKTREVKVDIGAFEEQELEINY